MKASEIEHLDESVVGDWIETTTEFVKALVAKIKGQQKKDHSFKIVMQYFEEDRAKAKKQFVALKGFFEKEIRDVLKSDPEYKGFAYNINQSSDKDAYYPTINFKNVMIEDDKIADFVERVQNVIYSPKAIDRVGYRIKEF